MVIAEHDPVQVMGELVGVKCGFEMSFTDRTAHDGRDRVQPSLLKLDETIARRPLPIVELDGSLDEDAAARFFLPALPVEPTLETRNRGSPDGVWSAG